MPDYFKQALKERKKRMTEKGADSLAVEDWQKYWRDAGPIRFAEEVLICPLDVPPYPNWREHQTEERICEGCSMSAGYEIKHKKFRENGVPYHIILSSDQKIFLHDVWQEIHSNTLLAAARGAGKTFVYAVFDSWKISTQDKVSVTCMGGSSKQSKIIQGYIDDWRLDIPMLNKIIYKSLKGIQRYCRTIGRSECDFPACSPTSARGPHVNIVQIDEACEAEDKSEDGAKAVRAVQWQTTGKRATQIMLASTAHYIHGMFYEYMTKPDFGFYVYQWAIAKHISGEKDPIKVYTDKDPSNWLPNVWWLTEKEIHDKRRSKSDEEWLCEALGGASMASGAVFQKKDLDVVICNLCEECNPWKWKTCKLCQLGKLGDEENPTRFVIERRAGFDYGVSDAPCALSVFGRKNDIVVVLYSEEKLGIREEEKIEWIIDTCKHYDTWTFIPDPAVAGKHLNEKLEDLGFAVYSIPEDEKQERVYNVVGFIEKHKILVPKAFWSLTQSLRKLAWDKDGKIRKHDDHSFDTCQYGLVDWHVEEEGGSILDEFFKREGKTKTFTSDEFFGKGINWE